jgi:hypothetical protein
LPAILLQGKPAEGQLWLIEYEGHLWDRAWSYS